MSQFRLVSCLGKTVGQPQFTSNFLFRQLFDRVSCTYTYILGDSESKEAIIIDPVIELVDRDINIVKELGLHLKFCVNTHVHADHITGSGYLKKLVNSFFHSENVPHCQSVISVNSCADADIKMVEGDKIQFGPHQVIVRETPGHTNGCVTLVCESQSCAFTGDALLIRGCGRTDFQDGSSNTLYDSVWNKIFSLPDHFALYPAHDYNGFLSTSVAEEKAYNPRLTKSRKEFIQIMNDLGLPYPKKIDVSLPANRVCGLFNLPDEIKEKFKELG